MGKGQIISSLGDGKYSVKLLLHGRQRVLNEIEKLDARIIELQQQYEAEPDAFKKSILLLQKTALEKRRAFLIANMPSDPIVTAWCADFTDNLSGNIATIEIQGERREENAPAADLLWGFDQQPDVEYRKTQVNIRPGYTDKATYAAARDGQLQPVIASSPEAAFFNRAILPGWQKFEPIYRIGIIRDGSIDFTNHKCDVCLEPAFSSQLNIGINKNAGFSDCASSAHTGFVNFCNLNPGHPACTNTKAPIPQILGPAQVQELADINKAVNQAHAYQTDSSGYAIGDRWDIMGPGDKGDCEDFALTKMQALIDAGWPVHNLLLTTCYTEIGEYHAVLTIKTQNVGDLVLDNRSNMVVRSEQTGYSFDLQQRAGMDWVTSSTKLTAVPIEYMNCHSAVFADGDRVIVEFGNRNWNNPKIIGFAEEPIKCNSGILHYIYGSAEVMYSSLGNNWIPHFIHHGGFDLEKKSWKFYNDLIILPRVRVDIGYSVIDGQYLVQCGGWAPALLSIGQVLEILKVSAYLFLQAQALSKLRDMSKRSRSALCGFSNGTWAFAIGGSDYSTQHAPGVSWNFSDASFYNDSEKLNFYQNTWASIQNIPRSGGFSASFATDGFGYVIGGTNSAISYIYTVSVDRFGNPKPIYREAFVPEKTNYQYNFSGDSWASKQQLPMNVWGAAACVLQNNGYLVGGTNAYITYGEPYPMNDKGFEFTESTNSWKTFVNFNANDYNLTGNPRMFPPYARVPILSHKNKLYFNQRAQYSTYPAICLIEYDLTNNSRKVFARWGDLTPTFFNGDVVPMPTGVVCGPFEGGAGAVE